jgi:hypothetical protein
MNSVNHITRREKQIQESLFMNKMIEAIFSQLTKSLLEEN